MFRAGRCSSNGVMNNLILLGFLVVFLTMPVIGFFVPEYFDSSRPENCAMGCFGYCATDGPCFSCLDYCKGMPAETAGFLNGGN